MKIQQISLLLLFFICSCKRDVLRMKPEDSLPAITQNGENTFGCLVDGQLFLAKYTIFGQVKVVSCGYYFNETARFKAGSLFLSGIDARNQFPVAGNIFLHKMDVFKVGRYKLESTACPEEYKCDQIAHWNSGLKQNFFAEQGELIISKLDLEKKIIAGTFNFTAKDKDGKTVKITDGRFDLKIENDN